MASRMFSVDGETYRVQVPDAGPHEALYPNPQDEALPRTALFTIAEGDGITTTGAVYEDADSLALWTMAKDTVGGGAVMTSSAQRQIFKLTQREFAEKTYLGETGYCFDVRRSYQGDSNA